MIVAFRVDSSTEIGSGHVMRCLALAEGLRDRGAAVTFVCRDHEGHLVEIIRARGFAATVLSAPRPGRDAAWGMLGVPWEQDATDSLMALPSDTDWLVVDHYGLGASWEAAMRERVPHILVMDDLADRRHDCDVLIDPTYPGDATRYSGLVPTTARLLLGPRYAQMSGAYAAAVGSSGDLHRDGSRLLVFYGGTDIHDLTSRTLRAASRGSLSDLPADVIAGATNPQRPAVDALARTRPGTTMHPPQPTLADLMSRCSIAATAGGVTLWERLCLGLPGVVVSLAENQVASCQALAEAGLITYLGGIEEASEDVIADALQRLLDEPTLTDETAHAGQALVDGLGAPRAAEILVPSSASDLVLREAVAADRGRYFSWANDPSVRRSALSTRPITWAEHRAWFDRRLASTDCYLLVLEAHGLPLGQARFDVADGVAVLDYSVDEAVRGRGWGEILLTRAIDALRTRTSIDIVADVRVDNGASAATLARAGFRPSGDDTVAPGVLRLRLQSGDDRLANDADLVVGQ